MSVHNEVNEFTLFLAENITNYRLNKLIAKFSKLKLAVAYEKHRIQGSTIKRRNKITETKYGKINSALTLLAFLRTLKKSTDQYEEVTNDNSERFKAQVRRIVVSKLGEEYISNWNNLTL